MSLGLERLIKEEKYGKGGVLGEFWARGSGGTEGSGVFSVLRDGPWKGSDVFVGF